MDASRDVVGTACNKFLPHNYRELVKAQVDLLSGQEVRLYPDFPQGGSIDISRYRNGRGHIRHRVSLCLSANGRSLIVGPAPYGVSRSNFLESIRKAVRQGKVQAGEPEGKKEAVLLPLLDPEPGAARVARQLYAHTLCEVSIVPKWVVTDHGEPVEVTLTDILRNLIAKLQSRLERQLSSRVEALERRHRRLELERVFIERRIYRRIDANDDEAGIRREVAAALEKAGDVGASSDAEIDSLLRIPLRRISSYRAEERSREVDEVREELGRWRALLANLPETTFAYLQRDHERIADRFPRRTEIAHFGGDWNALGARPEIDGDLKLPATDSAGTLFIAAAGAIYRVVSPVEELYFSSAAHALDDLDESSVLAVWSADGGEELNLGSELPFELLDSQAPSNALEELAGGAFRVVNLMDDPRLSKPGRRGADFLGLCAS